MDSRVASPPHDPSGAFSVKAKPTSLAGHLSYEDAPKPKLRHSAAESTAKRLETAMGPEKRLLDQVRRTPLAFSRVPNLVGHQEKIVSE